MNVWLRTNGQKRLNSSSVSPLNTSLPTITEHKLKHESQQDERSYDGDHNPSIDRSFISSESMNFLANQNKGLERSSSILPPKILKKETKLGNENEEVRNSTKLQTNKALRSVRFQLDNDGQTQAQNKISRYSKKAENNPLKVNFTQRSRYDLQTNESYSQAQQEISNDYPFERFQFIKFRNVNNNSKTKTASYMNIAPQIVQNSHEHHEEMKQLGEFSKNTGQKLGYSRERKVQDIKKLESSSSSNRANRFFEHNRNETSIKAKISSDSNSLRGQMVIKSIKDSEKIISSRNNTRLVEVNSTGIIKKLAQDENNEESWNMMSKRSVQFRGSVVKTTGRKQNLKEHVISIIEYCSNQVGIAIYNVNNGEIFLCQIIERLTYFRTISTIERFYPLQILYSSSLEHMPLIKKLMSKFKNTNFRNFKRIIFDETKGYQIYSQRGNKQEYNPDNKFIAFSALNALMFFLQNSYETKFNYNSLKIKWHLIEDLLVIESQTIFSLQIFLNSQTKEKQDSFVNNFSCLTYGGTRMLRANLLQPLSNEKAIKERQDLVEILLQDKVLYEILINQIIKFRNFELITAKFIQSPKENNIKSLKSYLSAIYSLSNMCFLLKRFHQKIQLFIPKNLPLIYKLFSLLNDIKITELRENIQSNFDEQILKTYETSKISKRQNFIFLFKTDKMDDDFIDVIRTTYSHTYEDILRVFKQIKQKSGKELKLLYNQYRGYYIKTVKIINLSELSQRIEDDIVLINEKKDFILFSTSILISLNNRLKESQKKLILLSETLLVSIIQDIQKNMDVLFDINYEISVVDMILSFVNFIKKYNTVKFVKPIIYKDKGQIVVQKMRTIWTEESKFKVSNEVNIHLQTDKKILIYEKQYNSYDQLNILYSIGYMTILTQIGCFVPAAHFSTDIYHTLLSKITLTENIQNNLSHFQIELHHFRNILDNSHHKNSKCLILLNELIKGTQYYEQLSLSMALINRLSKLRGKTIILISDKYQMKIIKKMSEIPEFLNIQEDEEDEQIKMEMQDPKRNTKDYVSPIEIYETKIQTSLLQGLVNLNFSKEFIENFNKISYRQQKERFFT